MKDRDLFSLRTDHLTIEGRSRAGHETWFRVRELAVALDIGRCPDAVLPMNDVFITHTHLDHAAGIPFYAGQRRLQGLDGGTIHVPAEVVEDVRQLMEVQSRLTGVRLESSINGMAAGQEIRLGRSHVVRAWNAPHRVAARAWEFIEQRHHLRRDLAGLGEQEIARLRKEGKVVDEEHRTPLLFYTGDTDRTIFEQCEALFRAEVLMIECSFVADGHQERAARYRHIHLDDIAEAASKFENQIVLLTHFSRRYAAEEIQHAVRRRVPEILRDRIRLALPEPWQQP